MDTIDFLLDLEKLLQRRRQELPQGSYTAHLFRKGPDLVLKKIAEEAGEVLLAAKNGKREELIHEVADLCYHAMVLLVAEDVSLREIVAELEKRHSSAIADQL